MQDFSNNATGLLSVGVNASATSLVLTDASSFPTPAGGSYFLATLIGLNAQAQETSWEIVKCTARAGNTLTVERAQEGTVAAIWGVASRIEMRLTAGFVNTVDNHIDNLSNPHGVTAVQVGAQTTLVSGTNIKTINSTSLLGSGNVVTGDVTLTGVQTLTNKTFTGYTETVYNLAGTVIAVANGTIQTKTLSGATTFTESLVDGQSVILGITAGANAVTWPTTVWSKVGGSGVAPTLTSTGVNWVILWQTGGTLRGAFLGTT